MVKLNKIYTRTGDDGSTGLVDGSRVSKTAPRVEAYGDVDEVNSSVGVARLSVSSDMLDDILARIQNELFDLGADLATPDGIDGALRIVASQVDRLEVDLDALNDDLSPLDSFVLPGGTPAAAQLHMARTIARRAERRITALAGTDDINPLALTYMNRLSDFLFVAARWCNHNGAEENGGDVKWVPGGSR